MLSRLLQGVIGERLAVAPSPPHLGLSSGLLRNAFPELAADVLGA